MHAIKLFGSAEVSEAHENTASLNMCVHVDLPWPAA